MKLRFLRPSYFVWIIVPLALFVGYLTYGLPHAAWSYAWVDAGQGYGPFAGRHYTSCTYLGPYGAITIRPSDGRCPWVRFFADTQERG